MSFTNASRDLFNPGTDLTVIAAGDIAGKRFVTASGTDKGQITVSIAAAGAKPLGVSKYDSSAGDKVGVARGHRVLTITAGSALTPGTPVAVGEDGAAVAVAGEEGDSAAYIVGIAVDSADSGDDAFIALG
ncbi:capsid cement protein [Corynebacterium sputi]|uniref:capsid cement protein n=1 Tax=Corynebacterium sputi TaxID=489915 RepID=UPI000400F368|nr:capsid cement protein [Corynebacterium sputi]